MAVIAFAPRAGALLQPEHERARPPRHQVELQSPAISSWARIQWGRDSLLPLSADCALHLGNEGRAVASAVQHGSEVREALWVTRCVAVADEREVVASSQRHVRHADATVGTRTQREAGCVAPFYAEAKGKCIIEIVPRDKKCVNLRVAEECRIHRRN